MTKRNRSVPTLYQALFEIPLMREEVGALRDHLNDRDAVRLLLQLQQAEQLALRLLDQMESGRNALAH